MKVFLLVITFVAMVGTYLAYEHQAKVQEVNECGEGFQKLDPSTIPPDQFPEELKGLLNNDGFESEICVRKVSKNGI